MIFFTFSFHQPLKRKISDLLETRSYLVYSVNKYNHWTIVIALNVLNTFILSNLFCL